MKTSASVLVVGSANTDMSIKLGRLPRPGETILGGEFASAPGGKGANQAVAAARAGAAVTFVARLGRDSLGDQSAAGFAADGINIDYLARDASAPSGVALIFVGPSGENSIAVASGANAKLSPADLRKARPTFASAKVVMLQLEIPMKTVEAAATLASCAGTRLILNPAPARELSASLLRKVFVLTPNETEAELLTGVKLADGPSVVRAAGELLGRGAQNVVITLGAGGAYVAGQEGSHWIPAYRVDAVDTTAAGDVFNGALAAALSAGQTLPRAARFASAAAALSVTRMGAQPSAPRRAEIERLMLDGEILPPLFAPAAHRNGHALAPLKRPVRIQR